MKKLDLLILSLALVSMILTVASLFISETANYEKASSSAVAVLIVLLVGRKVREK